MYCGDCPDRLMVSIAWHQLSQPQEETETTKCTGTFGKGTKGQFAMKAWDDGPPNIKTKRMRRETTDRTRHRVPVTLFVHVEGINDTSSRSGSH